MSRVSIIAGIKGTTPDPDNADSIPPVSYWDTQWTCQQWMTWTNANIAAYGNQTAVSKFVQYASQVSSVASDHFCPYESDFYNYYTALGVNFDNIFASTAVATTGVVQTVDTTATNLTTGAGNTVSLISNLLPLAGLAVFAWAGYTFLYKPSKAISGKRKRS